MQPGLVTVMMPAYNGAPYIREAIDSVIAQSYRDWELLVVNDGSTDDTAAIVRTFTDPRVRLLEKPNGGEASARNLALDHARGEFIAYLDSDDAFFPHHLAATVDYLRAHPEREAVYTDGFHIDELGVRLTTLQSRRRGPFEGRIFEAVVRASDVFGPPICVLLRHALVKAHGLRYDTRIVIGPDWDFFVRYTELADFGYLADQTVLYRVHQTNISSRVDFTKRAASLAICRENAIATAGFDGCSVETRAAVFYELLVNLLRGQPDRRESAMAGARFGALPAAEQARLLRLVAADAVLHGESGSRPGEWFRRARGLNPSDWRGAVLRAMHWASPSLLRLVLGTMSPVRGSTTPTGPFADLEEARRAARRPGASL